MDSVCKCCCFKFLFHGLVVALVAATKYSHYGSFLASVVFHPCLCLRCLFLLKSALTFLMACLALSRPPCCFARINHLPIKT